MTKKFDISHSYLIVGAGRLARHLSHYFQLLGLKFNSWNRQNDLQDLEKYLEESTHILVAISDDAILSFYEAHLRQHPQKVVIHFSGALNSPPLISAHPLMTFAHDLYDLKFYKRIHFAVTGAETLQEIFPELPNSSSTLFGFEKAKYHALCVLGGNFSSILIGKMLEDFAKLGIPEDAALPYIEKVISNTFQSPQDALTGPLVRRDHSTVEQNLRALANDPFIDVYKSFLTMLWPEYPNK